MTETTRPFENVSVDIVQLRGTHYLVGADRYSEYPLAKPLTSPGTNVVTTALEEWFIEYGKPISIWSDGGPQFRRELSNWCKCENIIHERMSAYHRESNGHVEGAVKDVEHLLGKTDKANTTRSAVCPGGGGVVDSTRKRTGSI